MASKRKKPVCRAWRRATERVLFGCKCPTYLLVDGVVYFRRVGKSAWHESANTFRPNVKHSDGKPILRELSRREANRLNAARLRAMGRKP